MLISVLLLPISSKSITLYDEPVLNTITGVERCVHIKLPEILQVSSTLKDKGVPWELFPLTIATFEGKEYFVFKNYDEFLRSVYGDYLKMPPKEKRVNHSAMKIDFGDEDVKKTNLS